MGRRNVYLAQPHVEDRGGRRVFPAQSFEAHFCWAQGRAQSVTVIDHLRTSAKARARTIMTGPNAP